MLLWEGFLLPVRPMCLNTLMPRAINFPHTQAALKAWFAGRKITDQGLEKTLVQLDKLSKLRWGFKNKKSKKTLMIWHARNANLHGNFKWNWEMCGLGSPIRLNHQIRCLINTWIYMWPQHFHHHKVSSKVLYKKTILQKSFNQNLTTFSVI